MMTVCTAALEGQRGDCSIPEKDKDWTVREGTCDNPSTHPNVLVRIGAGGSWYLLAPLVMSRSATGPAGGKERVQREQAREGGEVLALGEEGERQASANAIPAMQRMCCAARKYGESRIRGAA